MPDLDFINSPKLLAELHHLLWTKPFKNRGQRDEGWSCRDHSAIIACLLRAMGVQSNVVFGKMMMVTGPTAKERPYGLEANPHQWNFVEGLGHIDFSIRVPRFMFPAWDDWSIEAVVGSRALADPLTTVLIVSSESAYQRHTAGATHLVDDRFIIYQSSRVVTATSIPLGDLAHWINSPLGVQLEEDFRSGSHIYLQLLYHLLLFVRGERETLATLSKNDAWRSVSLIPIEHASEAFS